MAFFSSRGSKGGSGGGKEPPVDDDLLRQQMLDHKREQIKRDGFDWDAELQRMAEDDDKDDR